MLGAALRPSLSIRYSLIIAAAIAFILPPQGRCANCTLGTPDCSSCVADSKAPSVRSCCAHPAESHTSTNPELGCSQMQSRTCNCNVRPAERTAASLESKVTLHDSLTAIAAPSLVIAPLISGAEWTSIASADLPPPIPHRVLHCSWTI
jgi:hypothetical protein